MTRFGHHQLCDGINFILFLARNFPHLLLLRLSISSRRIVSINSSLWLRRQPLRCLSTVTLHLFTLNLFPKSYDRFLCQLPPQNRMEAVFSRFSTVQEENVPNLLLSSHLSHPLPTLTMLSSNPRLLPLQL